METVPLLDQAGLTAPPSLRPEGMPTEKLCGEPYQSLWHDSCRLHLKMTTPIPHMRPQHVCMHACACTLTRTKLGVRQTHLTEATASQKENTSTTESETLSTQPGIMYMGHTACAEAACMCVSVCLCRTYPCTCVCIHAHVCTCV